ncbi:MAG: VWD domain-containing protein [Actinomycetota bacterium]
MSLRLLLGLLAAAAASFLLAACGGSPPPFCGEFSLDGELAADCPPEPPPPPPEGPPPCVGCGSSVGDPHLTTFDQLRYDLQGAGEYTAVLADDLEVQLRMEPWGSSGSVSVTTAFGVEVGADRVALVAGDSGPLLFVDGDRLRLEVDGTTTAGALSIDRRADAVVVTAPDGSYVEAEGVSSSYLNVYVHLAEERRGTTLGLFGDADGDPGDDLVSRDGRPYVGVPDWETVHREFGHSWRVTDETSLFPYGRGESTATFTDESFPRSAAVVTDLTPEQLAAAEAACAEAGVTLEPYLTDCLLDVGLTGDDSFAVSAARAQARAEGTAFVPDVAAGGAVAWLTVLDGLSEAEPGFVADGAGPVIVNATDNETGLGVAVALDATTGEEVWRLDGIVEACPAMALGDGRIGLQAELRGPLLPEEADGTAGIVIVDGTTGAVERTIFPDLDADEPSMTSCRYRSQVIDGRIILDGNRSVLWAIDPDGGVLWHRPYLGPSSLGVGVAADGSLLHASRVDDGDRRTVEVALLDPATGRELDTRTVPGELVSVPGALLSIDGVTFLATTGDRADDDGNSSYAVALAAEDGELVERWRIPGAPDGSRPLSRAPNAGVVADERFVFYDGELVTGVDLDGEIDWTLDLVAFRNTGDPMAVADDGVIYDGTFGGPFAVAYTAEGELLWELPLEDAFGPDADIGQATRFGPVIDDLVYYGTSSNGVAVVVAFERGG